MNIFVSYTLSDGQLSMDDLRHLAVVLSNQRQSPYIDILHNTDSEPQRRVQAELERASLLLLCDTPGVRSSRWVQHELATAEARQILIVKLNPRDIPTFRLGCITQLTAGFARNQRDIG